MGVLATADPNTVATSTLKRLEAGTANVRTGVPPPSMKTVTRMLAAVVAVYQDERRGTALCGTYDPVSNQSGVIAGSVLRQNTIHHEAGERGLSHYTQLLRDAGSRCMEAECSR